MLEYVGGSQHLIGVSRLASAQQLREQLLELVGGGDKQVRAGRSK